MWWTPICSSTPWTGEPEKRERAREVLRRVGGAGTAALPAQVLSEFGGACLSKLEPRPDSQAIRREVERLMLAFPVLMLTGPVVLEATCSRLSVTDQCKGCSKGTAKDPSK
jgi:hypothetical protein